MLSIGCARSIRRLSVPVLQLRLLSSVANGNCESGSEVKFAERGESEGKGKTVKLSVSSLRIDTVAAAGLGLSRQCVIISYFYADLLLAGLIAGRYGKLL